MTTFVGGPQDGYETEVKPPNPECYFPGPDEFCTLSSGSVDVISLLKYYRYVQIAPNTYEYQGLE